MDVMCDRLCVGWSRALSWYRYNRSAADSGPDRSRGSPSALAPCQRRDVFREFGSSPVFLLRRPGLDLPSSAASLAGLRVGRQELGRPGRPGHGRVWTESRSSWEMQWWGACLGRRAAPASSRGSAWPQEGAAEAEGWAVLLQERGEHVHSKTIVPVFQSRT